MRLRRPRPYSRAEHLDQAARLRRRRRFRQAIELYRQVLDRSPGDAETEARLAECLAAAGRRDEAWVRYRGAAVEHVRKGFLKKAAGVLRDATRHFPRELETWEGLSAIYLREGRPAEAFAVLLDGSGRLMRLRERQGALRLLQQGVELQPTHFRAQLRMAELLAATGARREAAERLASLLDGRTHAERRLVRRMQLRLFPGPATFWRWLRGA